jgi:hypothetical protein
MPDGRHPANIKAHRAKGACLPFSIDRPSFIYKVKIAINTARSGILKSFRNNTQNAAASEDITGIQHADPFPVVSLPLYH